MSENEAKDRGQARARGRREKRRREMVPEISAVEVETAEESPKRPPVRRVARRIVEALPVVSDREAVLAANALFYRAVEHRDLAAMRETWAKVPHARCIHPG